VWPKRNSAPLHAAAADTKLTRVICNCLRFVLYAAPGACHLNAGRVDGPLRDGLAGGGFLVDGEPAFPHHADVLGAAGDGGVVGDQD
jgi:hypothetical protein